MKKVLITLALMTVASTWAYDVEIDGIYYNLDSPAKTAEVTAGEDKYTGSVVVPESITVDEVIYSVSSIGDHAFQGCSSLVSIDIPNSITSIGAYVFAGCSDLQNVSIPNSVTRIEERAFEGCSSLTSLNIPNSIRRIGSAAFENCKSLTSITIPNDVVEIENYTFYNCSSLTYVTIPMSLKIIGYGAFWGCSNLCDVYNYSLIPQEFLGYQIFPIRVENLHVPTMDARLSYIQTQWNSYFNYIKCMTDEMLDVKGVSIDSEKPCVYYDLNGSRMKGVPAKGIYIQNGKKLMK